VKKTLLDEATDGSYLMKKLGKKRYDVISFGYATAVTKMEEEGLNPDDYEVVFSFPPKAMGYAFHKDTDPALIEKMQAILDELHADGTAEKILKKYVN
jgi:polar amino acid transport system substrate-binding protein